MILLEIVIVIVGVGPEFQLLHLDDVLLAFGLVLFLFVLVLPLAIIHRFGDGGLSGGRDQDQVESQFLRPANRGQWVGMTSTDPSGNTARTSRARMASLTFSRILGRRGG